MMRKVENNDDGFTLVELMVVIVIIGLLATIVIINVLPSQDRAMTQKAKADIATLDQALELYRLNMMTYPSSAEGLQVLTGAAPTPGQPPSGYIRKLPKDPWGRDYHYEMPGKHGAYDVYSLGADGAPGGTGVNADVGNWQ